MPIRVRMVIPRGFLVYRRTALTTSWSYTTTAMSMVSVTKAPRLAGGIWKCSPMCRFMVVPCFTKRVFVCAISVHGTNIVTSMGTSFTICFVSSTWVTVHRLHFAGELPAASSFTAALFKNLMVLVESIRNLRFLVYTSSSSSCSSLASAGTGSRHLQTAAAITLPMRVNGLPCGTLCRYSLVPARKMAMEIMRPSVGMP
uniref:Uncharacterized protein n=1 Tax=Arundo donax TaxID=35708 RepID=A0A0A9DZ68_ARUDO